MFYKVLDCTSVGHAAEGRSPGQSFPICDQKYWMEQMDFLIYVLEMAPSVVCTCKYRSHFEVTFDVNAVNVRYTVW